jgi:hypothetical protein
MTTTSIFTPYITATLNGSPIAGVQRGRVVSTFTDPVTKIYLSYYPQIALVEGDVVAVTMGSGTHNVLSGTGVVYGAQAANKGGVFELEARGPLFKAQRYTNNQTNGITLAELSGGPATDEDIAMAVLDVAGVTYDPSDIGGTGIVRGELAPDAYTWREGETALGYLTRLSRASLGYRMIESIGGDVLRVQVYGRPQTTAQYFLNQGVDIFQGGTSQRDSFGKYAAITVTGFDYGDANGAVKFSIPDPTPAGVEPFIYPSEMIERALDADPSSGISAETVATDFVEPEVNRISIRVSGIKTPRDDLFGPGQTHQIDSSLLDLFNEKLWLYGVVRECDDRWFMQTLNYIGGSTATGGYTGPT